MRSFPLVSALLLASFPASAHIVFGTPAAMAGSYHANALRVGHGCAGSATVRIRVEIPADVQSAKPQPKAGWTISIEKAPLTQPVQGEGGALIRERIVAIAWTGRLDPDQFDEFGLLLKLGDRTGPLYFPTIQTCETGSVGWTTIPQPGQAWHDVKMPAPVIDVRPAMEMGQHAH